MKLDKLLQTLDVLAESKALPAPKIPNAGLVPDKKEKMGFIKSLKKEMDDPLKETKRRLEDSWNEFKRLEEYGPVGTKGMVSQAKPVGQSDDPAVKQQQLDQAQIQKSVQQLGSTLNQRGASQPLNKQKFQDVMTKLDAVPNTEMSNSDQSQMGQVAAATSKILQNPQTASQYKQLIDKADQIEQTKDKAIKSAQQQQSQVGKNDPSQVGKPQTESYDEDVEFFLTEWRNAGYDIK